MPKIDGGVTTHSRGVAIRERTESGLYADGFGGIEWMLMPCRDDGFHFVRVEADLVTDNLD